jgi:hypothetical protein
LLAVGNFKRQGGVILYRTGDDAAQPELVPSTIEIPEVGRLLAEEEAPWESWERLRKSLHGIAIPTASTLLAALWPERHAIVDRLALTTAVGLAGRLGSWSGPVSSDGARQSGYPKDWLKLWSHYAWYREVVLSTAHEENREVLKVERALYRLGQDVDTRIARPWTEYADALEQHLRSL